MFNTAQLNRIEAKLDKVLTELALMSAIKAAVISPSKPKTRAYRKSPKPRKGLERCGANGVNLVRQKLSDGRAYTRTQLVRHLRENGFKGNPKSAINNAVTKHKDIIIVGRGVYKKAA